MRRWFRSWWFRAACTLLLMGLLLLSVGPRRIGASLSESDPWLLLLGFFFTPIVIVIKVLRWLLLARTRGPVSFREALSSYLAGLTLATLTPLAAGEVGRGFFVRSGDRADLTGKVILDKLVDLSTVAAFAALGLILAGEIAARIAGAIVLVGCILAWSATLLLLPRLGDVVGAMEAGWLARLRIPAIIDGLGDTPHSRLALNAALSLAGFAFFYGQAFVILLAFWAEAPWAVISYFPIITLSTVLPIAIGGVGIREWTAVLLLRRFGVAEPVAFNTFFVHFVAVQLVPAVAGAAVIGSFRREEKED